MSTIFTVVLLEIDSIIIPFVDSTSDGTSWLNFKDIPSYAILSSNISSGSESNSDNPSLTDAINTTVGMEGFIAICETNQTVVDIMYSGKWQDREIQSFEVITTMKATECAALLSKGPLGSKMQAPHMTLLKGILEQELKQHRLLINYLQDHVHWLVSL